MKAVFQPSALAIWPVARLRHAPGAATTGEALTEALRDAVLAAVGVLTALNASVKNLDRSVAAHLGEHPDGAIFTSLPRSGQVNAAQVLAEWGDCRQAYEQPDSVAALAGVTPVTKESGKHRAVHFRWACNKRFRVAVTTFADNSLGRQPVGRQDLHRRPRQRQRPPARRPRPGPRLDPRHLALLARRRPLRPCPARRRRRARRTSNRANHGRPHRGCQREPREVTLEPGQYLFRQGDPSDLVYLIQSGEIEILRDMADGRQQRLTVIGGGAYFGELGPMLNLPRTASARALTYAILTGCSVQQFRKLASKLRSPYSPPATTDPQPPTRPLPQIRPPGLTCLPGSARSRGQVGIQPG